MGMYDTFRVSNKICCSSCGSDLKLEEGIQSKLFECNLEYYNCGDIIAYSDKSGYYIEYENCLECPHTQEIYISTFNGIYIGAFNNDVSAQEAINNFDLLQEYRNQIKIKNGFKDKFNNIRFLLSEVDTYFSSIKGGRSQILRLSRLDEVLDYSIFKTLKNILNKTRE